MVKRAVKKTQKSIENDSKIFSGGSSAYTSVIDLVSVTDHVDAKSTIEGIPTNIRNNSVTPVLGLKKRTLDLRKNNKTILLDEIQSQSGVIHEIASEKYSSSKHTKQSSEYQKANVNVN